MMQKQSRVAGFTAAAVAGLFLLLGSEAALQQGVVGYDDTPFLPGGKWRVHDSKRARPAAITPGTFSTPDAPGKPPSDAIVLFDGTGLSKWRSVKGDAAAWKVENGYMEVTPKSGDIMTRDEFGDCQLHIEWRAPSPPKGEGQSRGNSGIFLLGQYEIQVLDSFESPTYADGQAAAIYGQYPPLVNASRKPGEWQVYDIVVNAPRYKDGKIETPAYATVFHNGVVAHNHTAILGSTQHKVLPGFVERGTTGPFKLQDHGNPVRYRNIWVRPLKSYDEP